MRDCRKIVTFQTNRINNIPCVGIGTYKKTQEDLLSILENYPFYNLLIDTASKYENERVVSSSLQTAGLHRSQLFVIAKISYQQQDYNNAKKALYETLSNLQMNYVDLYLIHSPRNINRNNTWEQMIRLKEEGLTKEIGVSNFTCEQMDELFNISGFYPAANQIVCHSMQKDNLEKMVKYCREKHILIQDAQPFGGVQKECFNSECRNVLRYNYNQKIVSIFGTKSPDHLKENIFPFLEKDRK